MKNGKLTMWVRLPLFIAGILISSFGVALSAKCSLGITPIQSPPYVLSMLLPFSMGTITMMIHALFVTTQIILLRKKYNPKDLLQLVLALVYGRVMDLSTYLLRNLSPETYPARLGLCLLSVCIIGFGVYLTVAANVMFLAGEGLVSAITKVTGREFGKIKMIVDSSLLAFAVIVSLIFFHRLEGIREGTLIAAVGVGLMVQIYGKLFSGIFRTSRVTQEEELQAADHLIVTIAREFDPESMLIVKRLAEITGMKLYDDELIGMVAEESGLPEEYVRRREDRFRKGLLRTLYEQSFEYPFRNEENENRIFDAQKRVILKLAAEGDCIIIGRNANRILGKGPKYFHIYLHATPSMRAERTAEQFNIDQKQAEAIISMADEQRRQNYRVHLGSTWGQAIDYNLCLEVTHCDIEKTARFLQEAIEDFTWKGTGESLDKDK